MMHVLSLENVLRSQLILLCYLKKLQAKNNYFSTTSLKLRNCLGVWLVGVVIVPEEHFEKLAPMYESLAVLSRKSGSSLYSLSLMLVS